MSSQNQPPTPFHSSWSCCSITWECLSQPCAQGLILRVVEPAWGPAPAQCVSSCLVASSPLGVEARDEFRSVLSEPDVWFCRSEPTLEVTVDEEVEEERVFSLKSVMMTVTLPTVMANC